MSDLIVSLLTKTFPSTKLSVCVCVCVSVIVCVRVCVYVCEQLRLSVSDREAHLGLELTTTL